MLAVFICPHLSFCFPICRIIPIPLFAISNVALMVIPIPLTRFNFDALFASLNVTIFSVFISVIFAKWFELLTFGTVFHIGASFRSCPRMLTHRGGLSHSIVHALGYAYGY